MRRLVKVSLIAVLAIMLFILSGCTDTVEENQNIVNNTIVPSEENTVSQTSVEEFDVEEEFLKVIKSEEKFLGIGFENLEGQEGYLKDIEFCGQNEQIGKYAFVDMDGDGVEEMYAETTSDGGFNIVFHYEDGKVYGYLFSARAIYSVKADGTYGGTGGATAYGYFKIAFNKNEITETCLADRNDNIYEVDGKSATKEEFEKFEESQSAKPDAQMQVFINDEIGAEVLDFSNSDEIEFLNSDDGVPQSEYTYIILTLKKDGTITQDSTFPGATEHGAMEKGTYTYKGGKIIAIYTEASNPETPDEFYDSFNSKIYEIKDGKLYNQETPSYTAVYERKK